MPDIPHRQNKNRIILKEDGPQGVRVILHEAKITAIMYIRCKFKTRQRKFYKTEWRAAGV